MIHVTESPLLYEAALTVPMNFQSQNVFFRCFKPVSWDKANATIYQLSETVITLKVESGSWKVHSGPRRRGTNW